MPVFSFGENDIFKQVSNPQGSRLRQIQNKIQSTIAFAPCLFYGRGIFQYTFGLLPHRKPINTVGELAKYTHILLKNLFYDLAFFFNFQITL